MSKHEILKTIIMEKTSKRTIQNKYPIYLLYYEKKENKSHENWQICHTEKEEKEIRKNLRKKGYIPTIDNNRKDLWQIKIYGKKGKETQAVFNVNPLVEKILSEWKKNRRAKKIHGTWFINERFKNRFIKILEQEDQDIKEILEL